MNNTQEGLVFEGLESIEVPQSFVTAQVAVLGRPNAGKSTLLNALLDVNVSAVSNRPQTTRSNIRGILQRTSDQGEWTGQLVVIDTPGINFKKGLLDRAMSMSVEDALRDVDVVCWVADPRTFDKDVRDLELGRPGSDKLAAYLSNKLKDKGDTKFILVLSKADMVNKNALLPLIARVSQLNLFDEIIPVASPKGLSEPGSNLQGLIDLFYQFAKPKKPLFDKDAWTDLNERQLVQNLVREAIFCTSFEEVPYQSDCTIVQFKEGSEKLRAECDATIWAARDSLKHILVGKQGAHIKEIGMRVRKRYQEITGEDLILRLFVKIVDNWDSRAQNLSELGYVFA
jgi:GTP-binding protein Era